MQWSEAVRYGGRRWSGTVVGGGQVRWSEAVRCGGRRRSGAVLPSVFWQKLLHYKRSGEELLACFILDCEQVLFFSECADVYSFVCLQGTLADVFASGGVYAVRVGVRWRQARNL